MSNKPDPSQPVIYQIRIEGHLGSQWTHWFEGLTITLEDNGDTFLTGPVVDQAALYGLLRKMRDLGMTLISVNQVQCHPLDNQLGESTIENQNTSIKLTLEEPDESDYIHKIRPPGCSSTHRGGKTGPQGQ